MKLFTKILIGFNVIMLMPLMDWMGSMIGFMLGLGFLAFAVIIGATAFWLWMLIDLLQRKKFEDKLVWLVAIIFLNILGAILYYFLVYSKKR